ncbi:MAG TPA: 4Fe-4S dicluster domain-containing protein, partial [Anaerolineales bacterium]|nr:4Fe-4S dicluster domain-containing protein [Anaerolineales bacterium]
LRQLFAAGLVEALYLPMETSSGAILPALVTDPERLEKANPLAPVMPINGARAVSALTNKGSPVRLGVVLRPCEQRALVELVKLQQAKLDGVLLIGVDCAGTCEVSDYSTARKDGRMNLGEYLIWAASGQDAPPEGFSLRPACQMCTQPAPEKADIRLHLFGAALDQAIPITLDEPLATTLDLKPAEASTSADLQAAQDRLVAARAQVREKELAGIRAKMNSNGGLQGLFADCLRCHNCMTVCPICYCKTCLFRTAAFDHPPEHYLAAARRKGAARMLGDTLLFHATRLNHMSASCVSCGMCTSACPVDIPVGAIFSTVGEQVQAAFEYHPGLDVDEALPLITFQANEWTEIGEAR